MAGNAGKRRVLLEQRAQGRTIRQAAQTAGYHERTAERIVATPEFQADLQELLDQQAEEDRSRYAEHRRAALTMANQSLLKLQEILGSATAPPQVIERAARTTLAHVRQLFPAPELADLEDQLRGLETAVQDALAVQQPEGGGGRHLYPLPAAPDWPSA